MVLLAQAAANSSSDPGAAALITAIAVAITAMATLVGAIAGLVAVFRKKRATSDEPDDEPLAVQRERLWLELLEQLDSHGEEVVALRRENHDLISDKARLTDELHRCNDERLDLLRERGRPGERW